MPFPDSVINEAAKKAGFKCVACQKPFVEVHHIIPEGEGGSNSLENAAPLCAGCHNDYGADPTLRAQITSMRDNWYFLCESGITSLDIDEKPGEISETLETVEEYEEKQQSTSENIAQSLWLAQSGTASVLQSPDTFEMMARTSLSAMLPFKKDPVT